MFLHDLAHIILVFTGHRLLSTIKIPGYEVFELEQEFNKWFVVFSAVSVDYRKSPKYSDTRIIGVIILKFEQFGSIIE